MNRKSDKKSSRIDTHAPSRKDILALLESASGPMKRKGIFSSLGVESDDAREVTRRRLHAMVRDGQLIKNRRNAYGLANRMDLVKGRVSAHADGFGFVMPDGGGEDLYLSPRHMRQVMHGDIVLAAVIGEDHRGRKEGAIREVLERAHEQIVGRFVEESGISLVVPDNPRIGHDVIVSPGGSMGARPGQVVVAEILSQPDGKRPPVGRITEILGRAGAPGMATEIAIRDFGLRFEFPGKVEKEARRFGESVDPSLVAGRKDLRNLPLVTIDGADARDFDDAVFASRSGKGWRLVVAIADVSTYVRPGSHLDAEAAERATSVYFPARVLPMLPETLSNGLCSLKPAEDRLCLACDMQVNEQGKVTRSRFVSAVMRSHARLTYEQVAAYFESGELTHPADGKNIRRNLDDLRTLYATLDRARRGRGAIAFESSEVRFSFDVHGAVDALLPLVRNDAHKLIEECMILANVQAAHLMQKLGWPAPYRVHAPPPQLKLEPLERFLRAQGLKPAWRDSPEPSDFDRILRQVRERPDEKLIMTVLLRAQSLAVYRHQNEGHFGLALDAYAHFTSPIRRYPDLVLHRLIHAHLAGHGKARQPLEAETVQDICANCSERSRNAEEAERDVADRLKCMFMENRIGEEFEGIISGVTSFGLFVELDLGNVNGLVHVTELPNDYYHFDPDHHRLSGERRGLVFQLAERVRVEVSSVNVSDRKIDFKLVQ